MKTDMIGGLISKILLGSYDTTVPFMNDNGEILIRCNKTLGFKHFSGHISARCTCFSTLLEINLSPSTI